MRNKLPYETVMSIIKFISYLMWAPNVLGVIHRETGRIYCEEKGLGLEGVDWIHRLGSVCCILFSQ
jgi:hypothetical protein